MKQRYFVIISFVLLVCLGFQMGGNRVVKFNVPKGWPKPVYDFDKHPLTVEGIELGRKLFYDTLLSADNTISCANCHTSFYAFTHIDHSMSHGISGKMGTRNSPALMNLAWSKLLMWDGAVNHIEVQALAPITNKDEMGESLEHVLEELQHSTIYPKLFAKAYSDTAITSERMLRSMAQFMLTLVSADSKYDSVMRKQSQFTAEELAGYKLFQKNCNSCHTEPLFTNNEFRNNGLQVYKTLNDLGRYKVTQRSEDSLMFKVPTLRNIEYSYPYMHDGRFKRFSQFLEHYVSGIKDGPTLSPELRNKIQLNVDERAQLTAFLLTLSDKSFIENKAFAFPE